MEFKTSRLPNHVGHSMTRRYKWEVVFAVWDDDVQHVWFFGLEHALDGCSQVLPMNDALSLDVEALAHLHVVRIDLLHILGIAEISVAAVALVKSVFPL